MIRVSGVHKTYRGDGAPREVLAGVDLEVEAGSIAVILGPSGSGKSTLLNILGGLDRGYEGQVEVAGHTLAALSDDALSRYRSQTVSFVFQAFNLIEPLSVLENVIIPRWFDPGLDAETSASLEARGREALATVGLAGLEDRPPARLSGGERQRVAIARALVGRPGLLLCDEPTGNLDASTGQQIIELFQTLREAGQTLVIVTHEARVSEVGDRVYRLEDRRLVRDGLEATE